MTSQPNGTNVSLQAEKTCESGASTDFQPIHVVYAAIAVVGLVGNVLVVLVYVRKGNVQERPTHMFIIALALTDILALVALVPIRIVYR